MLMNMFEFAYEEGDKITELFRPKDISYFRNKYNNNCFGFAQHCCAMLTEGNVLCSMLTFKNGHNFVDDGIKVWDDINHKHNLYTHHSVVLLGDCIMDMLHSDRLISTQEYVRGLEKDNPNLQLDNAMTGCWYNSEGYPVKVTLDNLKSGIYD